jgi:predicted amidohydrolase YtcJ
MVRSFRRAVVFSAFLLLTQAVWAQQVPQELISYPDYIVHNAKIVSMDDAGFNSSPGKIHQAMAVRGDVIQFLGTNDQVLRYAGPNTRKIDLKGRTVAPGMIDTHNHLHNGAVSDWARDNPQKIEAIVKRFEVAGKTFGDITKGIELIIKEQMARPLPGQWAMIGLPGSVTGVGGAYLDSHQLNRQQLDQWAPSLPVVITGSNENTLINTAARNDFLMYYEVEPTDANEEAALTMGNIFSRSLIADRYFDDHFDELPDVLFKNLRNHTAGGYTTYSSHIQGMRYMPAFRQMSQEGRMPLRFAFSHRYCQSIEPDNAGCFLRVGDWQGMGNKYYWNVGLTLGGLDAGPPTICTTYEAPARFKDREYCILEEGNNYYRAIHAALRSRYRYSINHLFGDKPLDIVMDILELIMKENPSYTPEFVRSLRSAGDHCGIYPRPDQLPRAARLGFTFSCSAGNMDRTAPWLKVYGADKANHVSPVKSMIKHGIRPVAEMEGLGYDTGEGPTPWVRNFQFMTRQNARGDVLAPEEAIDRFEMMKMATIWAAYYVLREQELGSLEPGKLADFVVWSKDYFTVPQAEIPTVYPLMVVMGGEPIVVREELGKEIGMATVGPQVKFSFEREYEYAPDPDEVLRQTGQAVD